MSTVTINGKTYYGNNISIINGRVLIDGKVEGENVSGVVEIRVEGNINKLETDASVTVNGNVGNVSAGGSVKCGDVSANVAAGGSVNCSKVGGHMSAGGSIRVN